MGGVCDVRFSGINLSLSLSSHMLSMMVLGLLMQQKESLFTCCFQNTQSFLEFFTVVDCVFMKQCIVFGFAINNLTVMACLEMRVATCDAAPH